jgi:branched-chain amino acid transport system substrate-binding protein
MFRAGILMPRSSLFPSLGLDVLNGLKESLKKQNVSEQVKLVTDNIGFGIDEPEIYAKAEKMLLLEDTDIVMVCADIRSIDMLQPLFTASNKILLAVNFGANLPDSWQPAPTTISHSLNFCLHAHLTGKLAAKETNQQAINVISYYDGGYRQCFCMVDGHQSNGGVPEFNYVTTLQREDFTLAPMVEFMEEHPGVTTLLCLFTGDMAEQFYREISPLQKKFKLNLYVSPMMLEESLKNSLGNEFSIENVKGFIPWHSSLKNNANKIFKETIASSTGHTANYFFLLGWDAGLIVSEIIRLNKTGITNATPIIRSLTETSFDSPRGWMKIDPATQHSYGPSFLATCKKNMEITVGKETKDIEAEWKKIMHEKLPTGEYSSWRNTYLCI